MTTTESTAMKLILLMKADIIAALQARVPLVIESENALRALLTVVEVAEHATARKIATERASQEKSGERVRHLCIDFDGVIHSYSSDFQGSCNIPDPPVPGAFEWLQSLIDHEGPEGRTFEVCIYSSRSKDPGGREAMFAWFVEHGFKENYLSKLIFPTQKPAAFLTIDDRAICFEGIFPTIKRILEFKSWIRR